MTDQGKVRWALVGLGDIVRKRVGAALCEQPQSVLQACVTRNSAARADELAKLQPRRVYSDFDQMLGDPEVDAVYLATPVFLHAPQAIAALEAGKHVLVEKPMALSTAQCKAMLAAAARAGRYLAVAYYRRFWPIFQQVSDMLSGGALGQAVLVRLALHSWYAAPASSWRVCPEQSGGGVLSDVGCHRLDLLAWWFGLPQVVAADCTTRTHDYAAEDSVAALLSFAGGLPCTASFQWNSKTWMDELSIVGTEAKISIVPLDGGEMQLTRGREISVHSTPAPANAHFPLIDDFAQSISAGRPPRFSAADGMAATQIMDAMKQAASERLGWRRCDV